jgi:4-amino-4-deoxy-L-arabinose transferase-like glycosyltransferase
MRPGARTAEAAALVAVVVAAAALRIWAFGGVQFAHLGDDGRYVAVAQNLANGHAPSGEAEWFGSRIVFLWPVAGLFRLFGAGEVTAVAWPLAGSMLAVVAAYLLGRRLAGPRVALIAAAVVAVTPLEALMATRLRPDAPMAAFIALAVWAALGARRSRSAAWAAAAGLLLAVAWSTREMALVMAPVVLAAGWGAGRRALAWGAAGLVTVPVLSVAAMGLAGGDPLAPLTGTAGASRTRDPLEAWSWASSYSAGLLDGALRPRSMLFLLLPVVAAALVVLLVRRDRRAVLPAAWLGWAALYLELGTLPNLAKAPRFLLLASIPAALLVALAVERLGTPAAAAVAGATLAAAVLALAPLPAREHRDTDVVLLERVVQRMRDLPPGPVLAESHTWMVKLEAYLARDRLAVPRADDPEFLTAAERAGRDELRPLPDPADYRGGYVVEAPVAPRRGWPSNWGAFRTEARARVPWSRLEPVARVGEATILRWPAGVPAVEGGAR